MLEVRNSRPHVERLLADFEIAADKDLAISKTLTKMGPMLGLMGTLIPMGPALVGLSAGDISSMAYNMQVAFVQQLSDCLPVLSGSLHSKSSNVGIFKI